MICRKCKKDVKSLRMVDGKLICKDCDKKPEKKSKIRFRMDRRSF